MRRTAFAEGGRHGRHAQLDFVAVLLPLDAAVLRAALLGDVAAGEQLDPRDERLVHDLRDDVHVVQHAVDAQPHQRDLALRLEMDVRRPLLEGIAEEMIEGLHHRRGRRVELGGVGGEVFLVAEIDGHPLSRQLFLGGLQARLEIVEALVDRLDVRPRGDDAFDGQEAGDALDVVGRKRRERIVDGDGQLLVGLRDRHQPVLAREGPRQGAGDHLEVQLERVDLDEAQARKRGERLADLDLRGEAHLDHGLHDRRGVGSRLPAHALGLLAGQRLAKDQDLQQVGAADLGRACLGPAGGHWGHIASIGRKIQPQYRKCRSQPKREGMNWLIVGILYSGAYAVAGWMLRDQPSVLSAFRGVALLIPPLTARRGHRPAAPDVARMPVAVLVDDCARSGDVGHRAHWMGRRRPDVQARELAGVAGRVCVVRERGPAVRAPGAAAPRPVSGFTGSMLDRRAVAHSGWVRLNPFLLTSTRARGRRCRRRELGRSVQQHPGVFDVTR